VSPTRLVIGTNRWRPNLPAGLKARLLEEQCWVDTAEVYGLGRSELAVSELGPGIRVATKIMPWWWRSPKNVPRYSEHCRHRLGRDTLDLLLLHFPARRAAKGWLRALAREEQQGRVGAVGLSEYTLPQLREAVGVLDPEGIRPRVLQIEVSPWRPGALRSGLVPFCRKHNIEVWAFRILGGGALLGRPRNAHQAGVQEALAAVCARTGMSPVSVVVAWLRSYGVVPMLGVRSLIHLEQALDAREVDLPPDERRIFEAAVFA